MRRLDALSRQWYRVADCLVIDVGISEKFLGRSDGNWASSPRCPMPADQMGMLIDREYLEGSTLVASRARGEWVWTSKPLYPGWTHKQGPPVILPRNDTNSRSCDCG